MSGLCVTAALGGALLATLPGASFTLSWTHSVEKTEWREEWRVEEGRLILAEARVRGTGAGMEPGPDARLIGGWWVWTPRLAPQDSVTLAASGFTADHRLCAGKDCRLLSAWTGRVGEVVTLHPCRPGYKSSPPSAP